MTAFLKVMGLPLSAAKYSSMLEKALLSWLLSSCVSVSCSARHSSDEQMETLAIFELELDVLALRLESSVKGENTSVSIARQ